jgi:hypothetical protein
VRSIGIPTEVGNEVGVATADGKAYYKIASFLKHVRVPYCDILLPSTTISTGENAALADTSNLRFLGGRRPKVIITTRKERIQLLGENIVCIEDLGDDYGLAKEKLYSMLFPLSEEDSFIIGVDPGERTGIAAFINHREIESSVVTSMDAAISRVCKLLENSPKIRRIVRIGYGNPRLAMKIANAVEFSNHRHMSIQFVDERGTSNLSAKYTVSKSGTRDKRAAKLIAFREGLEFRSAKDSMLGAK